MVCTTAPKAHNVEIRELGSLYGPIEALPAPLRPAGLTTWLSREQPHLAASESMQISSCTAGRKWAYGTTSTVHMSSWSELRAEVLRRPRRARTSAADGRRQQQQVVAHVHDILLALLRDVARPAATRVREVGRGARAAAARRRGREVMSALAGRRGSGRRAGVARLGCSATRFERATVEAKSSKQRV